MPALTSDDKNKSETGEADQYHCPRGGKPAAALTWLILRYDLAPLGLYESGFG
jgi:hypothetical protein